MPFQRSCLYHHKDGMRVIEEDQEHLYKQLLENGWVDHPSKVKEQQHHEEQIRQHTGQRRKDAKLASKQI